MSDHVVMIVHQKKLIIKEAEKLWGEDADFRITFQKYISECFDGVTFFSHIFSERNIFSHPNIQSYKVNLTSFPSCFFFNNDKVII